MHIVVSTNFAQTLAWKHEYDVILRRHKQRTSNTNDYHMPLNEPLHEKFLRTPLPLSIFSPMSAPYFHHLPRFDFWINMSKFQTGIYHQSLHGRSHPERL